MPGELWRGYTQAGVETTYGVPVSASRRMYFEAPVFEYARDKRPHMFATGTRENVRAFTLGPRTVTGKALKQPLSAAEIPELLLMAVDGSAGVNGTYKPQSGSVGDILKSATFEWFDGSRAWQVPGCYVNKLKISGSVDKANEVEIEIFGKSQVIGSMTGSLAERTPQVIEGWESLLYLDSFGGTPGSTNVPGTLINWSVELDNQMKRKYFSDNTLDLGAVVVDVIKVTASYTFEASTAAAADEFADFDGQTQRLVSLAFGNNNVVNGNSHGSVSIDVPGSWESTDLGKTDQGTRVYLMGLQYVYDPSNQFGIQYRVANTRGSAWEA